MVLSLFVCAAYSATGQVVRFLRFEEAAETIKLFADAGLSSGDIKDSAGWNDWVRTREAEVRARIDGGVEDSITNLILYGASYTNLPRMESAESAASVTGELTATARARVHALAAALPNATRNERLRFVSEFLARKGIAGESVEAQLQENLRRLIAEQHAYQEKLKESEAASDPAAKLLARGTLFQERGLSADTSLLPNYALEDTLKTMLRKGAIQPGAIHRILVIGPGLDFTDKRDGYDFYPVQTIQPFAMLEAVARLGLGKAEEISVVTADLNAAVNAHVARLAERGRAGQPYTVQLPRLVSAEWSPEAVAYWQKFGEILGTPVKPLPVPASVSDVTMRAVAIRPRYAARIRGFDMNVVTQTMDVPEGQGFDLVVATNVLVYYDLFQQALAMGSIAHMMNHGGIFLANHALPAQHVQALEFLGRRTVAYTPSGAYGDDVVVYRRR
ncbi:MAG TPA: hypothetical protein VGR03_08540 [Candidatus Acidoferrum sp.]|nr:hypothetical protein [Candidatus Acidoferrum sp.]